MLKYFSTRDTVALDGTLDVQAYVEDLEALIANVVSLKERLQERAAMLEQRVLHITQDSDSDSDLRSLESYV